MIGPDDAITGAEAGLSALQTPDNRALAAAIAAASAGRPVLVMRLDLPGQNYYLVPWQSERGIVAVVQVDAQSGTMAAVALPAEPLQQIVMPADEAKAVVSRLPDTALAGEPQLVWQPSRETASAFQPLYRVPVEGGSRFVAQDGSVHASLTPLGKGG